MLNATFNNIAAISWWSVLLVEGTGIFGENHLPAYVTDKLLYRLRKILEIYTKQHTDQQYVSPQMTYHNKSDYLIYPGSL